MLKERGELFNSIAGSILDMHELIDRVTAVDRKNTVTFNFKEGCNSSDVNANYHSFVDILKINSFLQIDRVLIK